jgi:hypothetical protein
MEARDFLNLLHAAVPITALLVLRVISLRHRKTSREIAHLVRNLDRLLTASADGRRSQNSDGLRRSVKGHLRATAGQNDFLP